MLDEVFGRVEVCIHGRSAESMINACHSEGVMLYDIKRLPTKHSKKPVQLMITVRYCDMKRVLIAAKKCRARLHIHDRSGLRFFIGMHKRRIVLMLGWIAVVVFLLFMSTRVWKIDVVGCDSVDSSIVLEVLERNDVKVGCVANAETIKMLPQKIKSGSDLICWVGVKLSGVRLIVSIEETRKPLKNNDSDLLGRNLYASRDGVITRIISRSGDAYVRAGDVVAKGDILISGDVVRNDVLVSTSAQGDVFAQVAYTFTGTCGTTMTKKVRSGNHKTITALAIGENELYSAPYAEYELEFIREEVLLNQCSIFHFTEYVCHEIVEREVQCSYAEQKEYALELANECKMRDLSKECVILSEKYDVATLEDGSVCVIISIVAEENIARAA